jgi:hypothetical protein
MKKKKSRKLSVSRETVRVLDAEDLEHILGGGGHGGGHSVCCGDCTGAGGYTCCGTDDKKY